jgi:3,4-dihydroxy 2-butanone 4-phosphate synthase / GTP cyclohydrolase II
MPLSSTFDDALRALAQGRIIIVADSEDRENEADFLIAAERVTAESVHFMISLGRGQLCMPVGAEIARRLSLKPMVSRKSPGMPCFAVPVDHSLCKTGISPKERAFTIRKMVDETSRAEDFCRPGHIFALLAREGGLRERQGHTEATIDLMRLAGLAPAGVLCEICSCDGEHMATGKELIDLAKTLKMPMITIDDVIRAVEAATPLAPTGVAGAPGANRLLATLARGARSRRVPSCATSGPHRRNGKHQLPPSSTDGTSLR